MSAATIATATAESDLAARLLIVLRADPGVQALFGAPARIFDDETRRAAFPFANLERHETEPAGSAGFAGQEHRLTLSTSSRRGGRIFAKSLLGALRHAIESSDLALSTGRVVLAQIVYSDVVRTADLRQFRGLLRVRIITEEAE